MYSMGASWTTNRSLRLPKGRCLLLILVSLLFLLYVFGSKKDDLADAKCRTPWSYNSTYPMSKPAFYSDRTVYQVALVADLDTNSKKAGGWISYLLRGELTYYTNLNLVEINWESQRLQLKSKLAAGDRGMELSELKVFNGKLYSCDDRTGVVYEIVNQKVVPWVILNDGDGVSSKGFKCEWMAVKNQELYVGGLGKEWTSITGELENYNPMWIKKVSPTGEVTHLEWKKEYLALRAAMGIYYPGYMIHESGLYSDFHKRWFFLPRRASATTYSEAEDEKKGTNVLLSGDENFSDIQVKSIGSLIPTRGFSTFKFLPYTDDKIVVAIKSEEYMGQISSYITAFNTDGEILLPEQKVDDQIKYEGLEFV